MTSNRMTIFVRFVDGADVAIPVEAQRTRDNIFEILPHEEFEYNNHSVLFEFGPGDTVIAVDHQFEDGTIGLLASGVAGKINQQNVFKRIQFVIIHEDPDLPRMVELFGKSSMMDFCKESESRQYPYPAIQEWLKGHALEIQTPEK
jgi:hypothetical protein